MILLGAPIFDPPDDPRELARRHAQKGYRAAYCPKNLSLADTERLRDVRKAFEAEGVVLAELGVWGNLISPDTDMATRNQQRVIEALQLADELGVRCVVDYLGTFADEGNTTPHADNLSPRAFDTAVQVIRAMLDEAKPRRTKFCLEMLPCCLPADPRAYRDLIAAVDRRAFGVHLDPVNIVTSPLRYFDNAALLRECFELLGRHIVSCHAKDTLLRSELTLHIDEVQPGLGTLDYAVFLRELNRLGSDIPFMLEHLKTESEFDAGAAYIRQTARNEGVEL